MPGAPSAAAAHHLVIHHVGVEIAVVRGHVVAHINADVIVRILGIAVGHGQHQAVDAGNAVQLVNVPGEHAVDPHLGGGAAHAVSQSPHIGKVGVDQPGAVGFPQAVAVGIAALAAVNILPAVVVGHQAVLCQAQGGGSARGFGAGGQRGKGGNQNGQGQQQAQRSAAPFGQMLCGVLGHGIFLLTVEKSIQKPAASFPQKAGLPCVYKNGWLSFISKGYKSVTL